MLQLIHTYVCGSVSVVCSWNENVQRRAMEKIKHTF